MADTVIRASSLPNYPDCSLRWAATTMRKEIEGLGWELRDLPQNIGAANGTAVHAAAAQRAHHQEGYRRTRQGRRRNRGWG